MDLKKTLLLAISLVLSGPAHSGVEAHFNKPGFSGSESAELEDKIIGLINNAAPASTIQAALYTFNRTQVADALIAASRRGIKIEIVFDGGNLINASIEGHAINRLINNLICWPDSNGECIKFCSGPLTGLISKIKAKENYILGESCAGLVINHNKFFLFSELRDGKKYVIAQTSANMEGSQLKMYNDLLVIDGDEALFRDFSGYWDRLKSDKTSWLKKPFPTVHSAQHSVDAYFFPRMVSKDPVLEILKKIDCKLPDSSIRVSQSVFTRGKVATQMKKLESIGCKLEVLVRLDNPQSSPGKGVRNALGSSLLILPYKGHTNEEMLENSIHTKIVLIKASFVGEDQHSHLVMTGSHNLDFFSLRGNDESLIVVDNKEVYEKYGLFLDRIIDDANGAGIRFLPPISE